MERLNIVQSLNTAVEGFVYVLKTQRNMRLHFLVAILTIMLGIYFNLPKIELVLLLISITLVLAFEMINTALEFTIDLVKNVYHPMVRIIKDITAGVVFLAALNALIVGYILFAGRFALQLHLRGGISRIVQSSWHLTFIALLFVVLLVVVGKVFLHRGTPFKGGMPSGHAAFAFAMWAIIAFSTRNGLITVLSFVMAFLIARHRLQNNVHSAIEIIAGALVGILVTTIVFQLLV